MTDGDRNRVIMAELVARCWQEPAFADEFARDPVTKLREAGIQIPASQKVRVFRSDDKITYVGLSHKMKPEDYMQAAKTQFDPLLPLEAEHEIRLVQSTPDYQPIIIPAPPKSFESGDLSDDELASVAGGGGYLVQSANVATTVNVAAEANAAGVTNAVGASDVAAAAEAVVALVVVLI